MRRFILTDAQDMASIVQAAGEALAAAGCQFVIVAENDGGIARTASDSFQWIRGALENTLEDMQCLREDAMAQQAEEQSDDEDAPKYGPAEP